MGAPTAPSSRCRASVLPCVCLLAPLDESIVLSGVMGAGAHGSAGARVLWGRRGWAGAEGVLPKLCATLLCVRVCCVRACVCVCACVCMVVSNGFLWHPTHEMTSPRARQSKVAFRPIQMTE